MAELHEFPHIIGMAHTRHGGMLYPVNDVRIGQSLELYGEYAQLELAFLGQLIKPGHVVVEVGASIGVHTLYLARMVGARGSVIAFEPQRVPFMAMCGTLALNGVTNVFPFQLAAAARPGAFNIGMPDYSEPGDYGAVGPVGEGEGEMVRAGTVDGLGVRNVSLMVIDTYGTEADVIAGAAKTIADYKPRLYVDAFVEATRKHTAETIIDMGYEIYWHRPAMFNAKNSRGTQENIFGDERAMKFFCLPEGHGLRLRNMDKVDPAAL